MTFNYKKYSLEKLEEWVHDSLSCEDATPQEIYDVIKSVVSENYYTYKIHTERCYELLALLNGNGKSHLTCDKDDPSPECKNAWNDFWEESLSSEQYSEEELNAMCDAAEKQDKVVKWKLPVEVDGLSGECYVNLPDDLMEAANINENDLVEWIPQSDNSYILKKVTKPIKMDEC